MTKNGQKDLFILIHVGWVFEVVLTLPRGCFEGVVVRLAFYTQGRQAWHQTARRHGALLEQRYSDTA